MLKPNKKLNKPLEKKADRFEWVLLIACSLILATAYTLKALL
ncbi:hypothetical protein [Helicobacter pylori]|nr:hypothetical protein [Helicobacter pylori]EJB98735.1 hypothetical protein HPHPP1_0436 [Helicobacter pylori Hp P-1]EJC21669.1 hypothetical protein HPHPP1B_0462 [Helicobacter pylori Hp P-1b]